MDKKALGRIKALFLFFFLLFLAGGCNTVKGATQGAGEDLKVIDKADQQMREVLW